MRTVLFTWEIGQGFGHVLPLLPIARTLKEQGNRVIFALRDVRAAGALLDREGFSVLQAPTHPDQFFPANGPQPQTMADVLAIFGFTSQQHLEGMAAAWKNILQLCKPDIVIASYAPLSLLCARRSKISTLLLALPFELPARIHPLPILRTGMAPADSRIDDKIIATVNSVLGPDTVGSVHDIFKATKTIVMSFKELDAFVPRTGVVYSGNLFTTDIGKVSEWPMGTKRPKIFAYLNMRLPGLGNVLKQIHASPYQYCIVLRDATPAAIQTWTAENVCVSPDMYRLDQALVQCDAVLCYGGQGFVSACLLAAKPMVFLTRDLESHLTALQAVKLGAGILINQNLGITQALDLVLSDPSYTAAVKRFANHYKAHSPALVAQEIVRDIYALC